MTYWQSTKSPPNMWRPSQLTPERESALRELDGADDDFIAKEMSVAIHVVQAWQRYLGLREFVRSPKPRYLHGHNRKAATKKKSP